MMFELKGKGVNVGLLPVAGLEHVERHYVKPDNLYTLRGRYEFESLDFIVSKGLIFATKFHRILLKEWMNFLKVGGTACIIFRQTPEKNFSFLVSEVFELFGNDVETDWELEGRDTILYVKKLKPTLEPKDDISRWTFGIITNGKKDQQVDRIIASILALRIPHCQIMVCGTYSNRKKYKITYLHFTGKDERGWITKKKNLIAQKAAYENMVILHDRLVFARDWYEGMKKYGNYFDVLSCVQHLENTTTRLGDWAMMGVPYSPRDSVFDLLAGEIDYHDWDNDLFIPGSLYIMKKSVWKHAPWNEHLAWAEAEDCELCWRFQRLGIVPRFNPHSKCYSISWNHGGLPEYSFDEKRKGRLNGALHARLYVSCKAFLLRHAPPRLRGFFNWAEVNFPFLLVLRQRLSGHKIYELIVVNKSIGDIKVGDEISGGREKRKVTGVAVKAGRVLGIGMIGPSGWVAYPVKAAGNKFLLFAPKPNYGK